MIKNRRIRTISVILAVITALTALIPLTVSAAPQGNAITQTVNLATISKNARGDGFVWDNINDTLTLENLNINTADEFGMKLPKNATVILKGNNYITAASVGLVCTGQVTFEGSGTLSITAGDVGIDMTGVYTTHLARFRSGSVTVTAGKTAIRSGSAELSFMGSGIHLTVNGADGKAVDGRTVNVSGGTLTANAGIYASNALNITTVNATVTASTGAALSCPNGIKMTKVDVSVGASADSLSKAEAYNGEQAVKLISAASAKKQSILFAEGVPAAVDYVVFTFVLIAVAALIAIPIYLKKKKTEKLIAEYEAAHPTKKTKVSDTDQTSKKSNKPNAKK